jgi:uncharacterized membrane protein YbhN (UPF0104 family)
VVRKKVIRVFFKAAISLGIFGYLFFKVDWRIILDALRVINPGFYLMSMLLALVGVFLHALKYYFLIRSTTIARSLPSMVKIIFGVRFYALFLPSALGTEAVKWYKVTRNERERTFFMASSFFERSMFIFLLLVAGLVPLFLYSPGSAAAFRAAVFPPALAVLMLSAVTIIFFLSPTLQSPIKSMLLRLLPSSGRWKTIAEILGKFSLKDTSVAMPIFGLSLMWHLIFIGRMIFLVNALTVPLGAVDIMWMASLVLLLQVVPVSIAGIGVREGAYAYLFTLFSLPPEYGVLTGILFFSQLILIAVIGGLLELMD